MSVPIPNFEAIGQTVAEVCRFFDFSRWRPRLSWIFKISNFWQSNTSRGLDCLIVPNFVAIDQTVAEIWRFLNFWATVCKTVRPVPSDRCLSVCPVCNAGVLWYSLPNFGPCLLNRHCVRWGPSSPERGTAANLFSAQVYYDPHLRYWWSLVQDGGRRHLGYLNFWNFNGRKGQ